MNEILYFQRPNWLAAWLTDWLTFLAKCKKTAEFDWITISLLEPLSHLLDDLDFNAKQIVYIRFIWSVVVVVVFVYYSNEMLYHPELWAVLTWYYFSCRWFATGKNVESDIFLYVEKPPTHKRPHEFTFTERIISYRKFSSFAVLVCTGELWMDDKINFIILTWNEWVNYKILINWLLFRLGGLTDHKLRER